jgi:hypothetical protein
MSPILQTRANASAIGYGAFSVAAAAGDFESIATVTVGSGGAANVEFTSIPSTYTHLQIRAFCKTSSNTANDSNANETTFNSDTGNNYANHWLYGNGTSALAASVTSTSLAYLGWANSNNYSASHFTANVIDILDYANSNKFKTVRTLSGNDGNGAGNVVLTSCLWRSTSAITSIKMTAGAGTYMQYSHFALYGIKGA